MSDTTSEEITGRYEVVKELINRKAPKKYRDITISPNLVMGITDFYRKEHFRNYGLKLNTKEMYRDNNQNFFIGMKDRCIDFAISPTHILGGCAECHTFTEKQVSECLEKIVDSQRIPLGYGQLRKRYNNGMASFPSRNHYSNLFRVAERGVALNLQIQDNTVDKNIRCSLSEITIIMKDGNFGHYPSCKQQRICYLELRPGE